MRIGIDLMGSDNSPSQLFEGVLQAALHHAGPFSFVAFGTKQVIEPLNLIVIQSSLQTRIEFHIAEEVITMDEDPLAAVRRKKDSSLMIGMRLLKTGYLNALVCAGNTGAVIAATKVALTMLPGIRRPALLALLPTRNKTVAIIDAGGDVKNTLESILQYTCMGIAYKRSCCGIETPSVGLLNNGTESYKGTLPLRQAYAKLEALSQAGKPQKFHFAGNIEARELFDGNIDLLVTDGFTGNVLLKTAEGTAAFILDCFAKSSQSPASIAALQKSFHYTEYPGALVCGIDKIVVKCHGNASKQSIFSAILSAITFAEKNLTKMMRYELEATSISNN